MLIVVDGRGVVMFSGVGGAGGGGLGLCLVKRSPWQVWVRFPLMVLSVLGQYLATFLW